MGGLMPKIDYEDVYDFEVKRDRARREMESGFDKFLNLIGLLVLVAIIAFFSWLHRSIASVTGPDAATWIVWAGVIAAIAGGIWFYFRRRAVLRLQAKREAAREDRLANEGRRRAKEAVVRAKQEQPGFLAEYWQSAGTAKHGDPDLLDFGIAQELVVEVYGWWTMAALSDQGHDRVLEDDICSVFGNHRGVRIVDGAWALFNEEL
jgi:LPXTG-motif cell wall-anchored protein